MAIPPIVALELGTSKIIALVGEMREDGHVMITGMGEHPSSGIRKGEVIDLENVAICARAVLQAAEESGKVAIRGVHLAISGGHIQNVINSGVVPVFGSNGEITEEDVEQVMDVAKAFHLAPDRDILHTICQDFCIDDEQRVIRPEGMIGAKLSLNMLMIHGIRGRIHNSIKAVQEVPMAVQDVAFSGLCSALSVLTAEQKKSGVIVIDLGGGTTDYLVYANGIVATAGAFGVGGEHVTNDIALAFNIPMTRAEHLKRESGNAGINVAGTPQRVSLPPEVGFPGKTISLKSLHTVINARMEEILDTIYRRIGETVLHHVGAGVVLSGGGAHLNGVTELTEKIFGLPCIIGWPRNMSGLTTITSGPEYATCSGLIQYGFMTSAKQERKPSFSNWLKGVLGKQP
ncbi:MAG: cell division protein FtsA [Lentisphaerae bacterium]|nr:cell division protein FtsA [Lentisphaerota bacterium]